MLFEFFWHIHNKEFYWVPTEYQFYWGKTHCESNNFFRVCSNIVLDASGSAGIATYNSGEGGGLIDNNYFAFTTGDVWTVIGNGDGPDIYAPGYSVPVGNYAYTITYGTTNYPYIEHNIVTSSDTGGSRPDGPLDAYGGAKFVMRYNSFTNSGMGGWHGTDSGSYISTYGYEVYGNFMWYTNIGNHWDVAWDSRGGTGMIFSNTIAGQASSLPNNLGGSKCGMSGLMEVALEIADSGEVQQATATMAQVGAHTRVIPGIGLSGLHRPDRRLCLGAGPIRRWCFRPPIFGEIPMPVG